MSNFLQVVYLRIFSSESLYKQRLSSKTLSCEISSVNCVIYTEKSYLGSLGLL